MAPGGDPHADRLPGAGRLDESARIPQHRARLGGTGVQRHEHQPQSPPARDGLSGERRQFAHLGGQLQRRGRQHDSLCRPLPALPPVRFPRPDLGRRGGRLADRLQRLGTLLRRERPHDGYFRTRRRPGLSAQAGDDAAGADGQVRPDPGQGLQPAGLALVALRHRHRHPAVRRPGPVHQSRRLRQRLRPGREGEHGHHLLAPRRARRRGSADSLPGTRNRGERRRHGLRRGLLRRGGRGSSFKRRTS